MTEATLRQQLAEATRMMVMADLLDYSGHVSARLPGTERVLARCQPSGLNGRRNIDRRSRRTRARRQGTNVIACDTIPEAFLDSLEMEENVRGVINAAALGPLRPITADEIKLLKPSFERNTYRVGKTWEHSQHKARQAGSL
jgi:hypothetical protein